MQIAAQHPTSAIGLACQVLALEKIHHLRPLVFGQPPARTLHVAVMQSLALLLTFEQKPQHHQHNQPLGDRLAAPVPRLRQAIHQLGAQQHDQPGQIDPHQKQRHRGKGAVDQVITGKQAHIEAEQRLGNLEQHGAEKAAQ